MLMPKRVKHRKQFRGRMKGKAHRGNFLAYGEYGLQAMEPHWVTSQQIEAARIALTRYTKRGGQVWIKIFPRYSDINSPRCIQTVRSPTRGHRMIPPYAFPAMPQA